MMSPEIFILSWLDKGSICGPDKLETGPIFDFRRTPRVLLPVMFGFFLLETVF